MDDKIKVEDYKYFDDAISTITSFNDSINSTMTNISNNSTKLSDASIFMGPICDSCVNGFSTVKVKHEAFTQSMTTMQSYINEVSTNYKAGDKAAADKVIGTGSVDTSNIISGSNVDNAVKKYGNELNNADYKKVNSNLFTTTTTEYVNGKPVQVTHVVINDANQINGAPANGSYGNGLEKSSSAAARLGSSVLINGSHFNSDGTEDLSGPNHVAIVNGQVVRDGVSGGNEMFLDNNGNIFNAEGLTGQQLVDKGVKYSFSCHSTPVIVNGDTSPSYQEGNSYKRTVIGQSAPGEYYIITDTTYDNRLSDTAEYLKEKGCTNAFSLDQGGSVSLVEDSTLINNPSDENGERAVGDFLYFV